MTLVKVNNNGHKSLSSFVDEFFQGFPAGLSICTETTQFIGW